MTRFAEIDAHTHRGKVGMTPSSIPAASPSGAGIDRGAEPMTPVGARPG